MIIVARRLAAANFSVFKTDCSRSVPAFRIKTRSSASKPARGSASRAAVLHPKPWLTLNAACSHPTQPSKRRIGSGQDPRFRDSQLANRT